MVIVLAIIAILAAVVHREVVRSMDTGRTAALAQSLDALRQAVFQYRSDVRRYPTHLTQLSTQPATATDLCGRNVPPGFLNQWNGPYTPQVITTNGIPMGDAVILDALDWEPKDTDVNAVRTLFIEVDEVDQRIAEALRRAYDGEAGTFTDGMIRWVDGGNGRGILRFGLAVRGC
jgi:type II secretory pathway pseudopilin PulG